MNNNNVKLDIVNLKKIAPFCIYIGAGLGVLWLVGGFLGGLLGVFLLAAWAVCGGLYANAILDFGSADYLNIAINGAILAAIAELVYDILTSIFSLLRYGNFGTIISVSTFLQAAIVGAIGSVAWFAYQTNSRK